MMDWYDQACEEYDQDLRDGEKPSPWDYLLDYDDPKRHEAVAS